MGSRLQSWCHHHGADDQQASAVTKFVLTKYQEPHRHYHNLEHIRSSLTCLDQLGRSEDLIEGAIWFHDVIYDPSRTDNESESTIFFESSTTPWLEHAVRDEIIRLILATDPRTSRKGKRLEDLMVDIDLAVLGSEPASYERYRDAIRQEYGHVPEADFRRGRAAILEGILAEKIYRSPEFQHLEGLARQNLATELAELTKL